MATIVHAVIGYFVLLLVVRILRRRAGAQMTLFEFVLIFLMGGTILLSTVGNDRSVTNCTCAVIAVALVHRVLSWAKSKSPRFGALLDGTPVMIVDKGEWKQDNIQRTGLRHEDIEAAARGVALTRTEDIEYAVLERNGHISVMKRKG